MKSTSHSQYIKTCISESSLNALASFTWNSLIHFLFDSWISAILSLWCDRLLQENNNLTLKTSDFRFLFHKLILIQVWSCKTVWPMTFTAAMSCANEISCKLTICPSQPLKWASIYNAAILNVVKGQNVCGEKVFFFFFDIKSVTLAY